MIIGVNTRMLIENKLEGQGWFTNEILKRVVVLNPQHEFHFYFDRPYSRSFLFAPNVKGHLIHPRASMRIPFSFQLWYQYALAMAAKHNKCDVLISLDGFIPTGTTIKTVNVIHDLGFIHFPSQLPQRIISYYRRRYRECALAASRLATVSEYSRMDISAQYGVPLSEITVIPNAARDCFRPLHFDKREEIKKIWSNGKPYFVYTGIIQPRKNLSSLFKAFTSFKLQTDSDVKLLIVGAKGWGDPEAMETLQNSPIRADVVFTGYVSDEQLAELVGSALALTFVPHFEGFGIPVLESMQTGVPVICSNTTSLPEVSGGAAITIDPLDIDGIANAMTRIYEDKQLRADLIKRGLDRAKCYSWDQSAEILSGLIQELTV
jgi:glycosyltransferase involved in cell wall biosynthesis